MNLEELEARVRVLEDIEAIRRLKASYCDLCDAGLSDPRNRDALVAHFTEDAKLDFGMGDGSKFEGREGVETFFGQVVPGTLSFCMHMLHNSVIDVDGDTATGRWYFEVPSTNAVTRKAQWLAGRYHEEYVRREGVWKFSSIVTRWAYVADYQEGWGDATGDFRARVEGR